jgi:hypothetical protein
MPPKGNKKGKSKKQKGGALPIWLQNAINAIFPSTPSPVVTVPPISQVPSISQAVSSTTFSSADPSTLEIAPVGTPAGSIVDSDGSIVNPVTGVLVAPPGTTSSPVGSTVSSTLQIIPPIISGAVIGAVSSRIPHGSIVLTDGSVRNRFTGAQLAPPKTTSAPAGSLITSDGQIVMAVSGPLMLGAAPVGTPGGSTVNSDGSITDPNGTIVAPSGSTNAAVGSIVLVSGAIVASNAFPVSAPLKTLIPPIATLEMQTTTFQEPTTTLEMATTTFQEPTTTLEEATTTFQEPTTTLEEATSTFQEPVMPSTEEPLMPPTEEPLMPPTEEPVMPPTEEPVMPPTEELTTTQPYTPLFTTSSLPAPSNVKGIPLTFSIPDTSNTVLTDVNSVYTLKTNTNDGSIAGGFSNETVSSDGEHIGIFTKATVSLSAPIQKCSFGFTYEESGTSSLTSTLTSSSTNTIKYGFQVEHLAATQDKSEVSIIVNGISEPVKNGFYSLSTGLPSSLISSSDELLITYNNSGINFYINKTLVGNQVASISAPCKFAAVLINSATDSSQSSINNIVMGTYDTVNVLDVMLGGASVPPWLLGAITSSEAQITPTMQSVSSIERSALGPTGPTGPSGPSGPTGSAGPQGSTLSDSDFGMPLTFVSSPNIKIYTISNSTSTASSRYTFIKTTNDDTFAGCYTSKSVVSGANTGVFVLGRAVINGVDNACAFGFTDTAPQTYSIKSGSENTVAYGFYVSSGDSPVLQNMIEYVKVQLITDGEIKEPDSFHSLSTRSNSSTYVSAADRLTVSYDGARFNYYVNGVSLGTFAPVNPVSQLYGAAVLQNTKSSTKQCGVVDFQMGTYNTEKIPSFIIGGAKKSRKSKSKSTGARRGSRRVMV